MTTPIAVQSWSTITDKTLSEAAVRARFPPEKYRVSVYVYPPQTRLSGVMRRATCHVIAGMCRYTFESEALVRAGDVAELPEGRYSLEVVGDGDVVIVMCWELPFEFNRVQ